MNQAYHGELTRIKEGLAVYDSTGKKVGSVTYFRFGDEDPTQPGPETATVSHLDDDDDTFIEDIARALGGEVDIPEELRSRLLRYGYIQIDTGAFSSDCFATADQVAHVMSDHITLNVLSGKLIRA